MVGGFKEAGFGLPTGLSAVITDDDY